MKMDDINGDEAEDWAKEDVAQTKECASEHWKFEE